MHFVIHFAASCREVRFHLLRCRIKYENMFLYFLCPFGDGPFGKRDFIMAHLLCEVIYVPFALYKQVTLKLRCTSYFSCGARTVMDDVTLGLRGIFLLTGYMVRSWD